MKKNQKGFKLGGHSLPGIKQKKNSAFDHSQYNIMGQSVPHDHADDGDTGGVVQWEPDLGATQPPKPPNRPPNTSPLGGQNLPGNAGWDPTAFNILGQEINGGSGVWNPFTGGGIGSSGGGYWENVLNMMNNADMINAADGGTAMEWLANNGNIPGIGGSGIDPDVIGSAINFIPGIGGDQGGGGYDGPPPTNYGGPGSACFIPETLITMADGSEKQISEIELGDVVKSEIGESTVQGIDIHVRKITVYSINDSGHFVTANHPFKTTEGWKAINPEGSLKDHGVEADRLIVGDTVLTLDGEENIVTMEAGDDVTKVYNLLLDNEHVYYANGYLVHNEKVGDDGRGTPDPGAGASASSTNNSGKSKRRTPMRHAVGPQGNTPHDHQTMGGNSTGQNEPIVASGSGVSVGGGTVGAVSSGGGGGTTKPVKGKASPMRHPVGPQVDTLGSAPGLIGQTMGGYGASSGTGVSTGGGLVNPFAGVTPTNISGISQGGGPWGSGAMASTQPSMVPGMGGGGPAVSNNSPQGQAMMQQMMRQRAGRSRFGRRPRPSNPTGTALGPQAGPMASPMAKKSPMKNYKKGYYGA